MTRKEIYIVFPALVFALGAFVFKYFEHQYFKSSFELEVYLTVIGVIFLLTGIAMGATLRRRKKQSTQINSIAKRNLGLTSREYEVLNLIAKGYSNKEIAENLFLSIPTIKSHTASLFLKLDVQRRTQAVKKAKDLKILEE